MNNMNKNIVLNDHSRKLLKDRKNRAILANSETSKEYKILYKLANDYLEFKADDLDGILNTISGEEALIINDMLTDIIILCRDEWQGDESYLLPVEIIEEESKWKLCSLCKTKNRMIYYIKNKLNEKKMNVGSICINEFTGIKFVGGKNKRQLEREVKKNLQLKNLTKQFHGIKRIVDSWDKELRQFDILIPTRLELPYVQLGEQLSNAYQDYLNHNYKEEKELIEKISFYLDERIRNLDEMKQYNDKFRKHKFIATRSIVNWLEKVNQFKIIEDLKETGFITNKTTASEILEENFIGLLVSEFNDYMAERGIRIVNINIESANFIVKPLLEEELLLHCSVRNFVTNFGWVLFNGNENERGSITIIPVNIFKVSRIQDRAFLDEIILRLSVLLSKSTVNILIDDYNGMYDHVERNEIDLYDTKTKKVFILELDKFIDEYKSLAFQVGSSSVQDIEDHIQVLSVNKLTKSYTLTELKDLRTTDSSKRER